ncbi:unnamed protein product [Rotaria socialis]|uniref:SUMO-activating enzyme subunit 1 n=1 Tax=Rotaria socialis TaxID=392032 RepID=A0A818A1D0_9BILA|nr:unnamed protein product [Rotaria socialis]CAF3594545.1 unnamed protein product [Rotaria socialis]CAF4261223.1 unnamed protein product [Rotaria socialis]CAF4478120.1 unnamed protein product [Rotaria socialis]
MNSNQTSMLSDEEATLYDRQIRLWGADAQLKLRQTHLLLINVNSLSIEVCKNLCLAGVASITIFDNTRVTSNDVEENLTLTMSSTEVDEFKSVCTCRALQMLNPRVHLVAESTMTIDQIDEKYIEQFDYVCLFNYYNFKTIAKLNNLCRQREQVDENGKKQTYFFCAATFGSYGFAFKDLGDKYDYLSENSFGSESLIRGEGGGNESKKSEKVTTKSIRNYATFEKALTLDWKPNRRQAATRSVVTTYNLLRGLLTFHEQYHRSPALATHDVDVPNLMIILEQMTSSTAAASSSSSNNVNNEKWNEELLKDVLTDNNAVASIVGGIMSHDIVKAISKQEPKDNFFFFNGLSCVGLSIPIAC